MDSSSGKLSAFVVTFNRAAIIGTCLRGLRFVDELIVVDKSSTDATPHIAAALADRVISVPWSPTVEETRAFAAAQCTHDWILFLDDDECLSPRTAGFVREALAAPGADAYAFPLRHYILGQHDEDAYYWPEYHVRLFRRGALSFVGTVHAGIALHSDRVSQVPPETGVCIHHLSHQDTAQWVEKANRYTSRPDRARVEHAGLDLAAFAHDRIAHWLGRTHDARPGGYPQAVALLRAVYDLIDRLKVWEEENGLDGAARFRAVCAALDAAYGAAAGLRGAASVSSISLPAPAPDDVAQVLRRSLQRLRAAHEAEVTRLSQAVAAAEGALAEAQRRAAELEAALRAAECAGATMAQRADQAEKALGAIERSTCWRATAWPRRAVGRWRGRE